MVSASTGSGQLFVALNTRKMIFFLDPGHADSKNALSMFLNLGAQMVVSPGWNLGPLPIEPLLGEWRQEGQGSMAVHRMRREGTLPGPLAPPPPQDQSGHSGNKRKFQLGKSDRAIFSTQTFGSQTPPPSPSSNTSLPRASIAPSPTLNARPPPVASSFAHLRAMGIILFSGEQWPP